MEEAIKTGWWANRSTTTKVLIIGGAIAIISYGVYHFAFKKDDDNGAESESSKKDTSSSSNEHTATTNDSTQSHQSTTEKKEIPDSTDKVKSTIALPNNGVGCSVLITNFDRDFDYIKCNGIWHIISKLNPATPATKGAFKEWNSLEGQKVSIERLNRRYPSA